MSQSDGRFGVLPAPACRERLEHGTIGRVGWAGEKGPQILPVTYVVHDSTVVFRTDPRGPFARLQGGTPAVFEVDHFDPASRTGWSVVVRGRAYRAQRSERAAMLWREADPVPWAGGDRPVFVSITLDEVSGRYVGEDPEVSGG